MLGSGSGGQPGVTLEKFDAFSERNALRQKESFALSTHESPASGDSHQTTVTIGP